MNYQQWLEVRKQGIGSSDAATACGLNPYMSMLELWMIKTGRMQQNIEDESAGYAPLYWGKQLEPLVAEYYSMHTNNKCVESMQCYNILMKTNTLCWPIWIMPWWVMKKFKSWNVKP
jgi:putative phage-type endonuclease